MKNNTATLDCITKLITFKFKNEIFTVDITEGDLDDSWNSINTLDGVCYDFNFSWEDTKGCRPSLSIYGLIEEDGELSIDTTDTTSIKILGKPSADIFFKEERFKYRFDVTLLVTCRVYNENDEEVFKTKSFNKCVDEMTTRNFKGEKTYMIVMDNNNATKRI
jgi:hypothetical protein